MQKTPVMPDETNAARIRGMNLEDKLLTEGMVIYDIRFTAIAPSTGEPIRMIVNIEAHSDFSPGYPIVKRAIYYASRLISAQHDTEFSHFHYEDLRKVYSIWVCTMPRALYRNTITKYSIAKTDVVGHAPEPVENYNLLTVVMLCLGQDQDGNYEGILKMLGVLLSQEMQAQEKMKTLKNEFNLPMTQTMESEARDMCSLGEQVLLQGYEKGQKQGLEQGLKQGRMEIWEDTLRSLIANTGWPIDLAMAVLNVPEGERAMYTALLREDKPLKS